MKKIAAAVIGVTIGIVIIFQTLIPVFNTKLQNSDKKPAFMLSFIQGKILSIDTVAHTVLIERTPALEDGRMWQPEPYTILATYSDSTRWGILRRDPSFRLHLDTIDIAAIPKDAYAKFYTAYPYVLGLELERIEIYGLHL